MITIVPYTAAYAKAFKELNQWWIEKYFAMEPLDHIALDNPRTYILEKGGHIMVALDEGVAVGVCALVKSELQGYDYELSKMGVAPNAHGKGIGYQLGMAIIAKAKALKAKNIYLESNSVLKPALHLYRKLGFKEVTGFPSPYSRSDIQMGLEL